MLGILEKNSLEFSGIPKTFQNMAFLFNKFWEILGILKEILRIPRNPLESLGILGGSWEFLGSSYSSSSTLQVKYHKLMTNMTDKLGAITS